jgi:hypothetical protein
MGYYPIVKLKMVLRQPERTDFSLIRTGETLGKAGAFAVQGKWAALVKRSKETSLTDWTFSFSAGKNYERFEIPVFEGRFS